MNSSGFLLNQYEIITVMLRGCRLMRYILTQTGQECIEEEKGGNHGQVDDFPTASSDTPMGRDP